MKAFLNRFNRYEIEMADTGGSAVTDHSLPYDHALLLKATIKNQRLLFLAVFFMGLCQLLFILFLIHFQTGNVNQLAIGETAQTRILMTQLNAMNTQLENLSSTSQNSASFKQTLLALSKEMTALKTAINSLATRNDIQMLRSQLTTMKSTVDDQLLNVKRAIVSGKDTKDFVDPSVLPFQVISIDVISQQPFASINYNHHITPLTVGDSVAGWQIVAADYADGWVEFENDRDQYVKVSLQG